MRAATSIRCGAAILCSAISLAACQQPAGESARTVPPAPEATQELHAAPVESSGEILGSWDVVSFDGHEPARLQGTKRAAFADFAVGGVGLRMECNYSGRRGRAQDGRWVPGGEDDGLQTSMGCGEEAEAREEAFFDFFEGAPTIERLSETRLRLEADGAVLVLERPETRRLAFLPAPGPLQGRWQLVELTHFPDAGGYTGIGLRDVPGRIEIVGGRLGYSECPDYAVRYHASEEMVLEKTGGTAPRAASDCPELGGTPAGAGLPAPMDVLAVLHGSPRAERTSADGELVLMTDRLALLLRREP